MVRLGPRKSRPIGHIQELKVEYRGNDRWAVVDTGSCLNHAGEWEYEPMPSNRDDEFFARCRWPNAREAPHALLSVRL